MAMVVAGMPQARAAFTPVPALDLGCAAGYGLVNLWPDGGRSTLNTRLDGLTLGGGSNRSVPVTCVPSPTPSGPAPVSGDGHALLGGRLNVTGTVSGTPAPRIYANSAASVDASNAPVTIDNGWTTRALTDAMAVSSYIGSFTASTCNGITTTACGYADVSFARNSVQTLTGIGGLNVYNVSDFGTNVQLNVIGSRDDFFIFNVPGSSIISNQAWSIAGLSPSRVLFNITGQGNGVTLRQGANAFGTFLVNSNTNAACQAGTNGRNCNGGTASLASNTSLVGALIVINNGSGMSFGSGSSITGAPFNPTRLRRVGVPSPIPFLGAASAFGWSRRLRRRLKRPSPARAA
jgi:hypothetical protein